MLDQMDRLVIVWAILAIVVSFSALGLFLHRVFRVRPSRVPGSEPYNTKRSPMTVGSRVYFRTVTFHYVGEVVEVNEHEVVLDFAAWIADGTRWNEMLVTGEINEAEPYPDGYVALNRGAIVDASHWQHPLIREVKVKET